MSIEGTRRVMETTSHETANQYLRFGWSLINQYIVDATADQPRMVKYVLASIRRMEDTRHIIMLSDADQVNAHLRLGWKLIDRHVTSSDSPAARHETIHFVLAWQTEDAPSYPHSTLTNLEFETANEIDDEA